MTHPQPSQELTDWQKIRHGDTDASRAALAYYRERGWAVDEQHGNHKTLEAHLHGFTAGFDTARQQVEAQHAEEVADLKADRDGTSEALETALKLNVAYRAQLATLQATVTAREQGLPAIKLEAAMTALEALQGRGIYLHGQDGRALDMEATVQAVTCALDAALKGESR